MKDHAVKILYPPLNSSSNSPGAVIPAVTQLQLIHITDAPRSHSSCFSLTRAPRPLVLYPLHHLHHFVFLQCVFLRWLSRLVAQGSGIVSLFRWDILMRLNIFHVLPPLYLHRLIFLLISFSVYSSSFLFSYCICSLSLFPLSLRLTQISWQSLQLAVQSICFHSLGQICFSGYLTPFHVVLHNVIKKGWGIMSAEPDQTLLSPLLLSSSPPSCLSPAFTDLCCGWLDEYSANNENSVIIYLPSCRACQTLALLFLSEHKSRDFGAYPP